MSLDLIYHLVKDQSYLSYMAQLTATAERFICVYSSGDDERPGQVSHIRHRRWYWIYGVLPHITASIRCREAENYEQGQSTWNNKCAIVR